MATTRRPAARRATTPAAAARADAAQASFAARRTALGAALTKAEGAARGPVAAIFASGHEAHRNGDVDYEFRQPSTFWYLTGFEEPDAVAVLRPGHAQPYVLFVRPHDPQMAIWVGPRAGIQGAQARYGADAAYSIDDLEKELPGVLDGIRTLYFSFGADERVEQQVTKL
ncbi:MAG: aminopeptidase P N-terminal domain-containing protein, partial [Dehalococcoidia bacterium]